MMKPTKPTEAITATAFVFAYGQLKDNPLPEAAQTELQTKLSDICQDVPANIDKLDMVAEEYPALDERYQNNRELLQSHVNQRTKGPVPQTDHEAESKNQETQNLAIALESLDEKLLPAVPELFAKDPEAAYNRLMEIIGMGGAIG